MSDPVRPAVPPTVRYCPLCNRRTSVSTEHDEAPFVTQRCDACGFVHRIEEGR
jgi:hypothetical protein